MKKAGKKFLYVVSAIAVLSLVGYFLYRVFLLAKDLVVALLANGLPTTFGKWVSLAAAILGIAIFGIILGKVFVSFVVAIIKDVKEKNVGGKR